MHLPLGFSHLSSPLPFLNENTKKKNKQQKQVTKSFPSWKQVHVGMEASKTNQTRWEWHHNTHTIQTSCACHFANHAHHKLHWMNKVLSFAHHSPTHKRWPISAMFSSDKTSKGNLNSNIHRPSIAHGLHSFCIQSRHTISTMLSTATGFRDSASFDLK